ncbi:MAG: PIN domain-containing protein [Halanaerobiaceae bacterium]
MKKTRIIVDTSIWIDYFKYEKNVEFIENGLMNEKIFVVGPVVSELLQGVKTEKEYNKLINCIEAIPFIDTSFKDWKKAGTISYKLRRRGLTIPLTDIIISAIALNNQVFIYSKDEHFKKVPEVNLYSPED